MRFGLLCAPKEEDDFHEPVPRAAGSGPHRSPWPADHAFLMALPKHFLSSHMTPGGGGKMAGAPRPRRSGGRVVLPGLAVQAHPNVVRGASPPRPPRLLNP